MPTDVKTQKSIFSKLPTEYDPLICSHTQTRRSENRIALPERVLLIQAREYILLHVPDDLRLSQIVQRDLAKAGEHARDGLTLPSRGAD